MEVHKAGLSSHYHPPQHSPSPSAPLHLNSAAATSTATATASPLSNGAATVLPNHGSTDGSNAPAVLYPQSVAGKAPTPPLLDTVRKKRGRPRKYATPEEAAAAKRAASTSLSSPPLRKREQLGYGSPPSSSTSSKGLQLDSEVDTGQCFMPHVINVNQGEDVAQKIWLFVQHSQKELCILSASGCVCNASLLQSAASGGCINYEGRFYILSLSGSYVHTVHGERSGGLSACLVAENGNVIGGGVTGPLVAAGTVEVILATFQIEPKKDNSSSNKGDATIAIEPLASPTNASVSSIGYRPVFEPSRYAVPMIDDHQNVGANSFLIRHPGLQMGSSQSADWRIGSDSGTCFGFNFTGRTGHESNESPENGDYEHLQDRDS